MFCETGDTYTKAENLHFKTVKWFIREKKTDDPTIRFILYKSVGNDQTMRLTEMQSVLEDFGIYISITSLHRFWIDEQYTLKKIPTIAREADEIECYTFWNIFNGIKAKEQMKPLPQNEHEALVSLMASVNAMRDSNWSTVLKQIGYIA